MAAVMAGSGRRGTLRYHRCTATARYICDRVAVCPAHVPGTPQACGGQRAPWHVRAWRRGLDFHRKRHLQTGSVPGTHTLEAQRWRARRDRHRVAHGVGLYSYRFPNGSRPTDRDRSPLPGYPFLLPHSRLLARCASGTREHTAVVPPYVVSMCPHHHFWPARNLSIKISSWPAMWEPCGTVRWAHSSLHTTAYLAG